VIPTDTPPALQIDFTAFENNPIMITGDRGEWDYYRATGGRVVLIDDTFHLFYGGWGEGTSGIGYAVSADGLTFTKHDANPIFQPDGEGFDAVAARLPTPLVVGDTWMLLYNASATGEASGFTRVGSSIGLTTAPEPTGPWSQGQLVLEVGGEGEWDSGFVVPNSVIANEEDYRLYYTGGINPDRMYIQDPDNEGSGAMCGMATSAAGINWTKYDDPSTTQAPYAKSDPVLQPSPSGWDAKDVKCSVMKTDTGWEMLY
jgi:hypothetical protein